MIVLVVTSDASSSSCAVASATSSPIASSELFSVEITSEPSHIR